MEALALTPGTVAVLVALFGGVYAAVRRVVRRGLCDSGSCGSGRRAAAKPGCPSTGCAGCAGCAAVSKMVADMDKAAKA